jgi:cyclase
VLLEQELSMFRFELLGLCATGLLLTSVGMAQSGMDDVEIKAMHVAGRVYMLEGRGGNIGVSVGDDGILIIDDQFAPLADKIRAALAEIHPGELKFVLNTHWHGDHTGGNASFGREAPIVAHTNVRKRLSSEQTIFGRVVPASPKSAWPVITYDDSVSVHFNGEEIRLVHFPHCHTDGDTVVIFTESGVVHMGDLMFAGMFPFVDIGSGGDVENLARAVASLIERLDGDVKIIPGHGPLSTLDDLKTYHSMLTDMVAHVRRQLREGKSLDDIKAGGVPKKWESWGDGFIDGEKFIQIIHDSLTRERRHDDE